MWADVSLHCIVFEDLFSLSSHGIHAVGKSSHGTATKWSNHGDKPQIAEMYGERQRMLQRRPELRPAGSSRAS